jgi:hypothetical protein
MYLPIFSPFLEDYVSPTSAAGIFERDPTKFSQNWVACAQYHEKS